MFEGTNYSHERTVILFNNRGEARKITVRPLRKAKTHRDKVGGAALRNIKNKLLRAEWRRARSDSTVYTLPLKEVQKKFPYHTCNGKEGKRWKKWMRPILEKEEEQCKSLS